MVAGVDGYLSTVLPTIEALWQEMRRHHPQLPPVTIIIGQGDEGRTPRWGHFAPNRWGGRHEIMIAGESLMRPAIATAATLLHEGAHGLAEARGLKDTARDGRYHNETFRALAQEMGLHVGKGPPHGWRITTITTPTAARYAAQIEAIERAQAEVGGRGPGAEKPAKPASRVTLHCKCSPARTVNVSRAEALRGEIWCRLCRAEYRKTDD